MPCLVVRLPPRSSYHPYTPPTPSRSLKPQRLIPRRNLTRAQAGSQSMSKQSMKMPSSTISISMEIGHHHQLYTSSNLSLSPQSPSSTVFLSISTFDGHLATPTRASNPVQCVSQTVFFSGTFFSISSSPVPQPVQCLTPFCSFLASVWVGWIGLCLCLCFFFFPRPLSRILARRSFDRAHLPHPPAHRLQSLSAYLCHPSPGHPLHRLPSISFPLLSPLHHASPRPTMPSI